MIGVAVMLVVKPTFMFTPDGNWKEFGIGKPSEKYTPFPFWLFCLVWAIVAYLIVLLVLRLYPDSTTNQNYTVERPNNKNNRGNKRQVSPEPTFEEDDAVELPKGYYVLNKKATKLSGMPKYVYIGAEEPTD